MKHRFGFAIMLGLTLAGLLCLAAVASAQTTDNRLVVSAGVDTIVFTDNFNNGRGSDYTGSALVVEGTFKASDRAFVNGSFEQSGLTPENNIGLGSGMSRFDADYRHYQVSVGHAFKFVSVSGGFEGTNYNRDVIFPITNTDWRAVRDITYFGPRLAVGGNYALGRLSLEGSISYNPVLMLRDHIQYGAHLNEPVDDRTVTGGRNQGLGYEIAARFTIAHGVGFKAGWQHRNITTTWEDDFNPRGGSDVRNEYTTKGFAVSASYDVPFKR